MGLNDNQSIHKIWWNQLKTIGKELFRLLQKYVQSMNEKQNYVHLESKKRNFEHERENEEYNDHKPKTTKLESKTNENYEDPWTKSWNDDVNLLNDMFGFKEPKKGKRSQSYDNGFNMEDFFS